MPIDIVEMFWECTHCKATNKGRHKECQACGKTKSEGCREWLPDDVTHGSEAVVTDDKLLNKFEAGPDWKCRFCDSLEWRTDGSCANCGAPEAGEEKRQLKELEAESHDDGRPEEPEPPHQSTRPSINYDYDDDIPGGVGASPAPIDRLRVGLVAGGVVLAGVLAYAIFHTTTHHSTVTATDWTCTVHVERNQVMHHDGWSPDGDAFNVTDLGRRLHHYDHVIDHYDSVPYTYQEACGQTCTPIPRTCTTTPRSCTSNKNGSATCSGGDRVCSGGGQSCRTNYCTRTGHRQEPAYRDVPVMREYYEWDRWEWVFNRNVVAAGNDVSPHLPASDAIALGGKERTSSDTKLHVVLTDDDDHKTHDYVPRDINEFQSLSTGTHRIIKVGTMGGVEIVVPGK